MRRIKLIVLVTSILFFNGCEEQQDVLPRFPYSWRDAEEKFNNIEIPPGATLDIVLEVPNPPYEYSFRVIVPNNIDEVNGNPLVLYLHGGVGGAGREAHKTTQCVEPALESINAFVISPNADKVQWFETYNQEKIIRILNMAITNWPINTDQLIVTGYSDGGNGAWFYSEFLPSAFSAGIALASSYNTLSSEGVGRKIETPLYVIHSNGDELFPLEETQYWVNETITAGSDVKFVIADGLSHYAPCDYTEYFEEAIEWLQEEVWK